jgi:hypothetical protein
MKKNNFFEKNKYIVVKNKLPKDVISFIYNYFLLKRHVTTILINSKEINPSFSLNKDMYFGYFDDPQAPNSYSIYSDIAMETLLVLIKNIMEKNTNLNLIPNYSYARIYKKGAKLNRHKDRFSCEISTTIHLGGYCWPIYLEPNHLKGKYLKNGKYKSSNSKGIKILLNPGDMLIYRGNELEHWRNPLEKDHCAQVFLHYNDVNTKNAELNRFDGRINIGLPKSYQK